ncbi:MAG: 50S ribosomal protein L15 [Planctomycetes bacterium]|nr:50S ribosomal protein L15 [Planctomycetota bacterium]MCH9723603.1 50S ribosomal protein L15 [Planctomycetota bacterium]MCH9778421.1 50S ribosomal protein L15 [Planctomycetota bacterium]MCH9791576.1 50S ribosomal protein L15 [Planctomycetota bacterium]MDF1745953.1 50S ribosomal protein L15 [Gimesia sp.]
MIIDDVHRGIKKHKKRKRVGRGPGSGHGKTSTRGHNGYGSRSGSSRRTSFEGGQTPLALRVAKRGFNNKQFASKVAVVNVAALELAFENGDEITPEILAEKGLAKGRFDQVKILGNGDLSKKLTVAAHLFSQSAETKIEAAGGTVSRILS